MGGAIRIVGGWLGVLGIGMAAGSWIRGVWTPHTLEAWWQAGPIVCAIVVVSLQLSGRFRPSPASRVQLLTLALVTLLSFALSGTGLAASTLGALGFGLAGLGFGLEAVRPTVHS
jgi:hypothetical protein